MKVLMLNGSPRANSNTAVALAEMEKILREEGIETETVQIGQMDIQGCRACFACYKAGKCAIDDIVNEIAAKLEECDGLVLGSPVFFASANSTLTALLDRLFYSTGSMDKRRKVGAAVVVARRGGTTAAFDQLNKYFTYSGMPVAPSQYWNIIHGAKVGEAAEDAEGLQTMRTLARNMTFMMKSIALGKEAYGLPALEEKKMRTNYIR